MKKPIIGIAGNERPFPEDPDVTMNYIPSGFVEGVQTVGGLPLHIPLSDIRQVPTYIQLIDKLILTGGQNVLPQFYKEEQTIESDDYLLKRDEFELALITEAIRQKKPIFGVCRGLQLFNVAMGGTLHQEIEGHWQEASGLKATHGITVDPSSVLYAIYQEKAVVNSFHHQSIHQLAPNLTVIARATEDQVIEAVTTTDETRFLGVQWHPELRQGVSKADLALFDYVVHKL
ncbi:gamma-glutamyl-gamma-aminobutyrate hydrolase family protein [Streptococcus sp. DD13]|uniref:gamma-glutamyl-gamma-aminobutyrate hydrolase family protein n=1 Tax=Streptococcus sp. DD13 TaxID=1777881 RepID=UPI000791570D|nr:gamma-glutamyl-gamma-aminobutyrate hydrolase family protein [Streptococcus sp. DD13]KXT79092.1 Glutamine amidotransferase, class I [Streptococcus sp. DD13]